MKALSIRQPWASLISQGEKSIEVRTWRTHYRGDLLVCASARPDKRELAKPYSVGPVGVTICVVELVDVRPGTAADVSQALVDATGSFAWLLANPRPVPPIPLKGRLGLFTPPERFLAAL